LGRAAAAAVLSLLALAWLGDGAARSADEPPGVVAVWPRLGATGVPTATATDGSLSVTFTEPVLLEAGALELICDHSGRHATAAGGGPITFSFVSDRPFIPGEGCLGSVVRSLVSDLDDDDPPDHPLSSMDWHFRVEWALINELDAITAEGLGEFVELYDGGLGDAALDGLTLVHYGLHESAAAALLVVALDGYRTDEDGYFLIGDGGVAGVDLPLGNGAFVDGAGAVAIYGASPDAFPPLSPPPSLAPVDALVYGAAGPELLGLLLAGEGALDEDSRGAAAVVSSQRCPDGEGAARQTAPFILGAPTPGGRNDCPLDAPPQIVNFSPARDARRIPVDTWISIEFSEPVILDDNAIEIACSGSGLHSYTVEGEGHAYRFIPHSSFMEHESCTVAVDANKVADVDPFDPPDRLETQLVWGFDTIFTVADNVLINEVDADTPGIDSAEFIELYDGGAGDTPLDGLSVVLLNGENDRSYLTLELDGYATDKAGYFVVGNAAVGAAGLVFDDGLLQNGPDAVALVVGDGLNYPDGTTVTDTVPFDAFVYGRPGQIDPELGLLLESGQSQVDENGRGDADAHSNQRCPNGAGGLRMTAGYKQNSPTPGAANDCITDMAPSVKSVSPADGAADVGIEADLSVEFSEPVTLLEHWLSLSCDLSGNHEYQLTGGPAKYVIEPVATFHHSEVCTVTIHAAAVSDLDPDDPPDGIVEDVSWSFTTADPPADFVVINEIDPDTPGDDEAEFIEIYDGGIGRTRLDGLTLVLFNGNTDQSYRAIDLDGWQTDAHGYFVIGNAAVNPDIVIPNGSLQNGPDAAALYVADSSQFPSGTLPDEDDLVDAVVYGEKTGVSATLLALLLDGQLPADENSRGAAATHSLQRCPNGAGGQRRTQSLIANRPTPGEASDCRTDDPPQVNVVTPSDGATSFPIYGVLEVAFSEPVKLASGAIELSCANVKRDVAVSGGPQQFQLKPVQPLPHNQTCRVVVKAALVSDNDRDDPPDQMANDHAWSFATAASPPDTILINEIDADTPGSDRAEFIELYDGGAGHTDLSGLVLVFYNGANDRSYFAVDLVGAITDERGYLVVGNPGVAAAVTFPNGTLQNGADAVALYAGDATQFPNGTPVRVQGLIDAVVYGTADPVDSGLSGLLLAGEGQVDESGGGSATSHSSGRCPDGQGGQRRTATFRQGTPSPGATNHCVYDEPPAVVQTRPADNTTDVDPTTNLKVRFSEDVAVKSGWFAIRCETSGAHAADVSGGPREYTLTPQTPFEPDERCEVTIDAAKIADTDDDDPPDQPAADFTWNFRTRPAPPVANFVLINEIDADTPGSDTAEFIELYDGGIGFTDLSGLVLVFYNGADDRSYFAVDLVGAITDERGYFVLGNTGVTLASITFPNGTLQNGADAVALYAGKAAQFPKGTPLHTQGLIDAVVYGSSDETDSGLLALLEADQPQLDEAGRGDGTGHSLQRCLDGAGGPRVTDGYRPDIPTPGAANVCREDEPPAVIAYSPEQGAVDVLPDSPIEVKFSEDVIVEDGWFAIDCDLSGPHAATVTGGPTAYTIQPGAWFAPDETCEVTLLAAYIRDADGDDPPDHPAADVVWQFHTMPLSVIDFTTNGPLWIGETAVFTATISSPGPYTLQWDFGDGSAPAEGAYMSHQYTTVGEYQITLKVTTPTGPVTKSGVVVVRPRAVYWPVMGGR